VFHQQDTIHYAKLCMNAYGSISSLPPSPQLWEVHCLFHKLWSKDCCHYSSGDKQDSSLPNSSPIHNTLQACNIPIMTKVIECDCKVLLYSHLCSVRCILEDGVIFDGSNKCIKCMRSHVKFLMEFFRSGILELE
jgi:hypothetical protein